MTVFLTGDIHGEISITRLNTKNFPEQKELTKDDYVIILGDFGLIWDGSKQENYWLDWLNDKSFTTLFIDGNHENFDMLYKYPILKWNDGYIHKIRGSVFHLMRGNVFDIDDNKIFVMGGAKSIDKQYRVIGRSWWPQEIPSEKEISLGWQSLANHNYKVDYVLTHDGPIYASMCDDEKRLIDTYMEIQYKVQYKHWYFGHHHKNYNLTDNVTILYNSIIKLGDKI